MIFCTDSRGKIDMIINCFCCHSVVDVRLPVGQNVKNPRSVCPKCKLPLFLGR